MKRLPPSTSRTVGDVHEVEAIADAIEESRAHELMEGSRLADHVLPLVILLLTLARAQVLEAVPAPWRNLAHLINEPRCHVLL